jgi:FHS family L-fucose permease-like MFS transporter
VQWLYRISENATPTQIASFHASFALVLFMIGRFVGTWLLTKFPAHKLLAAYAAACVILITYALMSTGLSAVVAISLTYFFMSIMFPTIFALSIKNLGDQVKLGSGLVIMAIVGGAVLPPITGLLSLAGLENALIIPLISFLVILFFGMTGYKVRNT